MEQLAFFAPPYRYIVDTSSILSQKLGEPHTRNVYKHLWKNIEHFMKEQIIVTCSEIVDEIKDEEIRRWLNLQRCKVFEIDYDIQENVKKIVTENPKMIKFTGRSETSSGDAFLIATAMKYRLTVVTEENPDKHDKIPWICKEYSIEALNITKLCEREGWIF